MAIHVLIADDHAIVRDGLRAVLELDSRIKVAGLASTGREALAAARNLHPDVVILDVAMTDMNGIDAAELMIKAVPRVRILMLSMHASSEYVHRALKAGAMGYVLKSAATKDIKEAINTVLGGRVFLSSGIRLARPGGESAASPLDSLSARERQVLQLVVEGQSSSRIASLLNLSPKTVETYRSRLMKKLGVGSVAELAKFAVAHGLTPGT